ncbi:hypothetical protein MATL_G00261950 [Megalops atlanticus]|uniref:Ankyrin repeat and SOCS box protein 13 n=1 Tax=Megalops atlanticus TaxID=7932 RepID=A0A9D3SU56_MEGAT|nr:hypothetical protein MATL_G00261950 [Megalops atlanticus]
MEMDTEPNRPYFFGDIGCWSERTEVHEAAALGHALRLQELIQSGASVNIVAVDSITPLHEACIQGQTQCARLLLDAGAQLLLERGATVNPALTSRTTSPLHEACMGGNSDCVRLVISKGAELEAYDLYYGTPLHVACANEHVDCAKALLNAGARVNAARLHETALHHAAKVKNVELIEMLVEFGGNVYARDKHDKKPIDYTKHGSPPALCLQFYESTPLSLQHLSRVALRTALALGGSEEMGKHNGPALFSSCSR